LKKNVFSEFENSTSQLSPGFSLVKKYLKLAAVRPKESMLQIGRFCYISEAIVIFLIDKIIVLFCSSIPVFNILAAGGRYCNQRKKAKENILTIANFLKPVEFFSSCCCKAESVDENYFSL